ncbi:MAG TPA: hypothetical protein VJ508_10155, partial [Saprospiraceae bacterium]|nr:hypothetical protein [Saprospiraceae bacterium]
MYRIGKGPWSWLLPVFLLASFPGFSQRDSLGFWQCPDHLHKGRFWTAASVGAVTYTGTLITLNGLWYDKYPRTSFHFFNDINEWDQVDKAGHMFTAYFESDWLYHVSRWTGMKESHSIMAGAIGAIGLQATIEML